MPTTQTFTIVLCPEPEGGFTVRVPALPEVVTCGDTEEEALAMAQEAIELAVEHRLAKGESVTGVGEPSVRKVTIAVPEAA